LRAVGHRPRARREGAIAPDHVSPPGRMRPARPGLRLRPARLRMRRCSCGSLELLVRAQLVGDLGRLHEDLASAHVAPIEAARGHGDPLRPGLRGETNSRGVPISMPRSVPRPSRPRSHLANRDRRAPDDPGPKCRSSTSPRSRGRLEHQRPPPRRARKIAEAGTQRFIAASRGPDYSSAASAARQSHRVAAQRPAPTRDVRSTRRCRSAPHGRLRHEPVEEEAPTIEPAKPPLPALLKSATSLFERRR